MFRQKPPVFCFLAPEDVEHSAPEWVVWPAVTARAVIPVKRKRALDLFERVILDLSVATEWDDDRTNEAAAALHLDRQLVLLVLTQLQRKGLLDGKFRPTPKGELAASELLVQEHDFRVAWVYQAAWSGRVWPHMLTVQPGLVEARWKGDQRATLSIGSMGRPTRREAVVVNGQWDTPEICDDDVRQALEQREPEGVFRDTQSEFVVDTSQPGRLTVASAGEAVLLAAPLWTHTDGDASVPDPVTGSPDDGLWELLKELADSNPLLRELIGSEQRLADRPDPLPVIPDDTRLAEQRVKARLGEFAIADDLYQRCLQLERALLTVELAAGGDRPERIRSVITEAQAVLEQHFQMLLSAFPCSDAATGLRSVATEDRKGKLNQKKYMQDQGRLLGVRVPSDIGIQRPDEVERALKTGKASLRALVAASLLAATRVSRHPFAEALRRNPDLIHRIDDLAALRNKGAHASSAHLSRSDAREAADTVYAVISLVRADRATSYYSPLAVSQAL